jgi:hypothetical protein
VQPEEATEAPLPEGYSTIPPTAAVGAEYFEVKQGEIASPGQEVPYTFQAAPGQEFYFGVIDIADELPQVDWRLADEAGTQVFAACLGCGNPGVFTLERGGQYTLTVGEAGTQEIGAYEVVIASVRVHHFPVNLDAIVKDGVPGPGAGNLETPGSRDMYTFSAEAGQEVYFGVYESNTIPQADFVVLAEDGLRVFWACLGCGNPGAFTLASAGTYTIVIGSDENTETGVYSLVIANVRTDRFEISPGTPISSGQPGPGAGDIETPGGRDVYKFSANPGEVMHFEVVEAEGMPQVTWRLVDEAGAEVFDTCLGCSPPADITLERGGAYSVEVGGGPDSATGAYQLDIRRP